MSTLSTRSRLPGLSTRSDLSTLILFGFLAFFVLVLDGVVAAGPLPAGQYKLDAELTRRGHAGAGGTTRVIVTLQPGAQLPADLLPFVRGRRLAILNGQVVDLPNNQLDRLAALPAIFRIHYDRPVSSTNYRTSLTVGANIVHSVLGLSGKGVGVAVIDSGLAMFHDDFSNHGSGIFQYGNQRVSAFVDFVHGQASPYDDNGHGTHVSGIIAGNGYDSNGQRAGIAPEASLISLKVLDTDGHGNISNLIAALDWVLANHTAYNIRVVNMSVGAGIYESYSTDPLTLAAKKLVDAGIVVVAAAGNLGKNDAGTAQYGGITAPANAPWVLTVGASSTMGTPSRDDDTIAAYSSRGPTFKDWSAKPDLVAPGSGTESPVASESNLYATKPAFLLAGLINTPYFPYLSLSGTSMAAPVVTGTVALMFQVNPALTPNAAKAILQYTSQPYAGYNALTQGAGFLNTLGAVRLARFFATAKPGDALPVQRIWGKRIIWGNHMLRGGVLLPTANAWHLGVTWGAFKGDDSTRISWGEACADQACTQAVWPTHNNVVWGSDCGGGDCDNIVWGDRGGDNDNIVWGDSCGGGDCDNIVWGDRGLDADNIVWGDHNDDNIVWGDRALENILWSKSTDGVQKPKQSDLPTWTGPLPGETYTAGSGDPPGWLTDEMLFNLVVVPSAPRASPVRVRPIAPVPDPIVAIPASSTSAPAGSGGGV